MSQNSSVLERDIISSKISQNASQNFIVYLLPTLTSTSLSVFKVVTLYLFSDGYMDQQNDQRRKIGKLRFRQLLQEAHPHRFDFQKELLLDAFQEHKGEIKQRDDVILVGLKI